MIHNRSVKEVRRYDIFKLVVLLFLLLLLIFMVWRDEDDLSQIATGDEPPPSEVDAAYPAGEDETAPAENAPAYPGDEDSDAAYPGQEDSEVPEDQIPADNDVGDAAYPGQEDSTAPVDELPPGDEAGDEAAPAEEGTDQSATPESPAYPGPDDEGQPAEEPPGPVEPTAGSSIADDRLFAGGGSAMSGTGVPGTTVVVLVNDEQVATAKVTKDGTWSAPAELEAGPKSIVLQTLSEEGELISESEPLEVVVQEPIMPAVDLPGADVYAYGLTLTGTGQPDSEVQILADDIAVSRTSVGLDGVWAAEINLEEGTYNIDVAALDGSGNMVEQIPGLSLPVLPLAGPQLRTKPDMPEFDALNGLAVWRGVADPGTQVAIVNDDTILGSAAADDAGQWEVEANLDPGSYDLSLAELDSAGNITSAAEPVSYDLSAVPPEFVLPDGSVQVDENEETSIVLPAGEFNWSGQAEANSTVAVIINKKVAVTIVADEAGNWSVAGDLKQGQYDLQLAKLGESGAVSSISAPLSLVVSPSLEPVLNPIAVDLTNGNVDITGTTKPDTAVDLFVNEGLLDSTTSDADGTFIFLIRLSAGRYFVRVETTDADGVRYTSAVQAIIVPEPEGT